MKDPYPETMLLLTGVEEGLPMDAQNYFMPAIVALDYDAMGVAWLHGKVNAMTYGFDALFGSLQWQSANSTLVQLGTARIWSQTASVDRSEPDSTSWYGDFTDQATARLHAHFFEPYLPSQTSASPVTTLWSPSVHAVGP